MSQWSIGHQHCIWGRGWKGRPEQYLVQPRFLPPHSKCWFCNWFASAHYSFFNGICTSLPVLCSPWIPPSHTSPQQILTEQWRIYWHAQWAKHKKMRFVQIQTSQEPGAQKTPGMISNDMDIFKLCRDLLPPWYFYLEEKKPRKHLSASRWGLPSPHLDAKHLLLQESCDCSCSFSQTPLSK